MDNEIPVKITYHQQRSSTARIRGGEIHIRVSSLISRREQQKHIDELLKNVMKGWEKHEAKIKLSLKPLFKGIVGAIETVETMGARENLLLSTGDEYLVSIKKAQGSKYKVQKIGNKLIILWPIADRKFNYVEAEECLWRFLMKDQLAALEARLNELRAGWLKENFKQVRWRQVMSRWGSCDKRRGIIMLSIKLLIVEPKLLDYVCVHELAHLKYADHSDLFWDLVEQKMPDWRIQRKRLRQYE